MHSIENLTGVAGALVSDEQNLVFTSNRGENTVGIFAPDNEADLAKIGVGIRPNGLAYDPGKELLVVANVGDPKIPYSFTLSMVNVKEQRMTASVCVPGRTRWTVFDEDKDEFATIGPHRTTGKSQTRRIRSCERTLRLRQDLCCPHGHRCSGSHRLRRGPLLALN